MIKYRDCQDHEFVPHQSQKGACLHCYRKLNAEYQRKSQQEIRDMLNEYKLEQGCVKCGYKENVAALQFDHIVPVFRVKKWTGIKTKKEAKELMEDKNIQVLCANCHCVKTRENGDYKMRSLA